MNIPPKYSKVYEVESTASDPHLCGPLEVRLSTNGVSIRWAGEEAWREIDWYEIAACAEQPGKYREIIDEWKTQAFEEGLSDGVKANGGVAVLDYTEELRQLRERQAEQPGNGYKPKPPRNPRGAA